MSESSAQQPITGFMAIDLGAATQRVDGCFLSPIALERWESEGGALPQPQRTEGDLGVDAALSGRNPVRPSRQSCGKHP
jgi:hypothetical protein